jgi:hypothetical protein
MMGTRVRCVWRASLTGAAVRCWRRRLGARLAVKRRTLAARLSSIGFSVLPAQGTYFLVADFAPLLPLLGEGAQEMDDVEVRRTWRPPRVALRWTHACLHACCRCAAGSLPDLLGA